MTKKLLAETDHPNNVERKHIITALKNGHKNIAELLVAKKAASLIAINKNLQNASIKEIFSDEEQIYLDNYNNILQVLIQKEFKTTPIYREITPYDEETGYHMGVYLCLGQKKHSLTHTDATAFSYYKTFSAIQAELHTKGKVYVFFCDSKHKIKKKAEQMACKIAIEEINK